MSQFDPNVLSMEVAVLNLPVRPSNCLRRTEIESVRDLVQHTSEQLMSIPNMGKKSVREIERSLLRFGLRLGMNASTTWSNAPDSVLGMPIRELQLPARPFNCLRSMNLVYVRELVQKSSEELMAVPNMGSTSVRAIEKAVGDIGLRLGMSAEEVIDRANGIDAESVHELDMFIDTIHALGRHRIYRVTDIAAMTHDEISAISGMSDDKLTALVGGLARWGLALREQAGTDQIFRLERGETVREELIAAICHLLAGEREALTKCFLVYHGVEGRCVHSLRKIGASGVRYGFERPVSRERVRQILDRAERIVRGGARLVEIARWTSTVEKTLSKLPSSARSFALTFGYSGADESRSTFEMLDLCANIFSLDFPFELKTLESEGLGSVVVERDADQGISRLLDTLGGPFAALTEISGITGVSEERLEDIIDASPRWEFLDPERRYFWKRPRLPPTNFRLTGNPVLNCICKIFSVARVVRTADLTQSIIRERSLRQDDAVLHVPASVLEGVAEGSGLFEVGDGYISRKGGIEWCTVGRRDVALLRACVEYGRVVSSRELYSWLVRCGLTEENANITVAYSPFLVHTRSGVGTKEGIYRFVVDQEHLDLDGPCQQVVESDDDQSSSDAEEFNDGTQNKR